MTLTYLVCKYSIICCVDCKKTLNNEWHQVKRKSTINEIDNWLISNLPNCFLNCWTSWKKFYKNNFASDSPLAIIRTQINQTIEIILQSLVFCFF